MPNIDNLIETIQKNTKANASHLLSYSLLNQIHFFLSLAPL